MPGIPNPQILLHWQAIEPLIRDDQHWLIARYVAELIQKYRVLLVKHGRKICAQDRAGFEKVELQGLREPWN